MCCRGTSVARAINIRRGAGTSLKSVPIIGPPLIGQRIIGHCLYSCTNIIINISFELI